MLSAREPYLLSPEELNMEPSMFNTDETIHVEPCGTQHVKLYLLNPVEPSMFTTDENIHVEPCGTKHVEH